MFSVVNVYLDHLKLCVLMVECMSVVVNNQFELREIVLIPFMLICSMMRVLSFLLLGLCVCVMSVVVWALLVCDVVMVPCVDAVVDVTVVRVLFLLCCMCVF